MEIVTAILGIIGSLASVVTTGLVSAVNTLKKENSDLKAQLADATAKLDAAGGKTQVVVDGEVIRREKIISSLKEEIVRLESNANHDAVAVRERLNKLLSMP